MRERLALVASVSTVVLALALSPSARAQQDKVQNPTAGQDRDQKAAETETIRGVIAAITAEGEVLFDHRSNRAVAAEAAFVTVIGSPVRWEGNKEDKATATDTERSSSSGKKRHNVYIAWMTPRTKVCEASKGSEKSGETQAQNQAEKREVAFDQLEVGDHVEIQFARREDSGSTNSAHQTEQMRRKHGRDRTHVGYATSVTILPAKDAGHSASGAGEKPREGSQ